MEFNGVYKGTPFIMEVGIDTFQLISSTPVRSVMSGGLIRYYMFNRDKNQYYYKIDPEDFDPDANNSIETFITTINRIVDDYGLEDAAIIRLDIKFDFRGIDYNVLYPLLRLLVVLFRTFMEMRNNYSSDGLGPIHKTVAAKNHTFEVEYYNKQLHEAKLNVDGRIEFRLKRLHITDFDNTYTAAIPQIWYDLAKRFVAAANEKVFLKAETLLNSEIINSLRDYYPHIRKNGVKEYPLTKYADYFISRHQLITLLKEISFDEIDYDEKSVCNAADHFIKKEEALGDEKAFRRLVLFKLNQAKLLSMSLLYASCQFFQLIYEPDEAEMKKQSDRLKYFRGTGANKNKDLFEIE